MLKAFEAVYIENDGPFTRNNGQNQDTVIARDVRDVKGLIQENEAQEIKHLRVKEVPLPPDHHGIGIHRSVALN